MAEMGGNSENNNGNVNNIVYVSSGFERFEVDEKLTINNISMMYPDHKIIVCNDELTIDDNTIGIFIEASGVEDWNAIADCIKGLDPDINVIIRFLSSPLNSNIYNEEENAGITDVVDQNIIRELYHLPNVTIYVPCKAMATALNTLYGGKKCEVMLIPSTEVEHIGEVDGLINPRYEKVSIVSDVKPNLIFDLCDPLTSPLAVEILANIRNINTNLTYVAVVDKSRKGLLDGISSPYLEVIELGKAEDSEEESNMTFKSIADVFQYKSGIFLDLSEYSTYNPKVISAQSYGCGVVVMNDNVMPYAEYTIKIPIGYSTEDKIKKTISTLKLIMKFISVDMIKNGMKYCMSCSYDKDLPNVTTKLISDYYTRLLISTGNLTVTSEGESESDEEEYEEEV